jgi:predicted ATPase
MITKFSYSHPTRSNFESWTVNPIHFRKINYIVAQNATGKSRILRCVEALMEMLTGNAPVFIGSWNVSFKFPSGTFDYSLTMKDKIVEESLYIDEVLVLERVGDKARLFSKSTNSFLQVSPPSDGLVINFRRDKLEFPYFEELFGFASKSKLFKFGHIHATDFIGEEGRKLKAQSIEDAAHLLLRDIPTSDYAAICQDINSIGYNIESIEASMVNNTPQLLVREKGLVFPIEQRLLSQGMYRAIALIIYLHYLKISFRPSLVMIDDIAEGLDYERASKLSQRLESFFEELSTQVVITSNHNFFLDKVSLKYWTILYKKGTEIMGISEETNAEAFRKFRLSGLSPFDVFSSNFLSDYISQ